MLLKVRDVDNRCWWYIFNFDRVRVIDPFTDESQNDASVPKEKPIADLHVHTDLDSEVVKCQSITCITDQGEGVPVKEYSVVFNTVAFLCTDSGETVQGFFPNGRNRPVK